VKQLLLFTRILLDPKRGLLGNTDYGSDLIRMKYDYAVSDKVNIGVIVASKLLVDNNTPQTGMVSWKLVFYVMPYTLGGDPIYEENG